MNGVINVYKEAGMTSFDVVARLRKILNTRKIGHAGTLDPDAVGVLPVCVGNATKLCDMLTDETKEYVAVLRLGISTDTQDTTGRILSRDTSVLKTLSDKEIKDTIMGFVGSIEQVPPMYSALKVNGKKLYELAREGIEVQRKARKITIEEIEILDIPQQELDGLHNISIEENDPEAVNGIHKILKLRVVCSKGTYIRTLCHDIGSKLGCGGCMQHLERTRVGRFTLQDAYTLEEIGTIKDEGGIDSIIIPVDIIFDKYRSLYVLKDGMKLLRNGNKIPPELIREYDADKVNGGFEPGCSYRIYGDDGLFYGIFDYHSARKCFSPVKIFMPEA